MKVTRRGVVGTALGIVSDIVFNKGSVTKYSLESLAGGIGQAEAQTLGYDKISVANANCIETVLKAPEEIRVAEKIADGMRLTKGGDKEIKYDDAYRAFRQAYDNAHNQFEKTGNYNQVALMVLSAAQAGRVSLDLFSKTRNKAYIERAVIDYGDALASWVKLHRDNVVINCIKAPKLGKITIADEITLRKRLAFSYEQLSEMTRGNESAAYIRSAAENYYRLAQLTLGKPEHKQHILKHKELLSK